MHETLWEMHRTQDQFIAQIDMLTQKIMELQTVVLNQQGQNANKPVTATAPTSASALTQCTLKVPGGGNLSVTLPNEENSEGENAEDSNEPYTASIGIQVRPKSEYKWSKPGLSTPSP